jgi:hypothetical protein
MHGATVWLVLRKPAGRLLKVRVEGGGGGGGGYMAFMAWAAELGAHCLCVCELPALTTSLARSQSITESVSLSLI